MRHLLIIGNIKISPPALVLGNNKILYQDSNGAPLNSW